MGFHSDLSSVDFDFDFDFDFVLLFAIVGHEPL